MLELDCFEDLMADGSGIVYYRAEIALSVMV